IAVPDGGATWIGFGLDAKLLAPKAASSIASAPDKDTLGKTPTAEAFRATKANGGMLVTLRGLAGFTALGSANPAPCTARSTLANHGTTPISVMAVAQPKSQNAPAGSSVATVKLPRGAIEDLVRIFISR